MTKALALTTAALALLATAVVGNALAVHSWGNYHWSITGSEVALQVGDNVDASWDSYLDTAIADWDQSSKLALTEVAGGTNPKNCRPTSGRIEVCNASYGNNGWLGLAQIWVSGDHITQAVAKVNDTYFNTSTYDTQGWRSLVMCQEVGHDFGLGHQDEDFGNAPITPHTCMDYHVPNPSEFEHPNNHDYDQLGTIYGHTDGSGGGGGPPNCPGQSCKNKQPPPFAEASPANGSVYVDALAGGVTRVTHVLWAPFGR